VYRYDGTASQISILEATGMSASFRYTTMLLLCVGCAAVCAGCCCDETDPTKARETALNYEMHLLNLTFDMYVADHGRFPATLKELATYYSGDMDAFAIHYSPTGLDWLPSEKWVLWADSFRHPGWRMVAAPTPLKRPTVSPDIKYWDGSRLLPYPEDERERVVGKER